REPRPDQARARIRRRATPAIESVRASRAAARPSRTAYQPTIQKQGGRFIAYVGHHGGKAKNPLTGVDEDNGTSIVDVTDPARPRSLVHVPARPGGSEQ